MIVKQVLLNDEGSRKLRDGVKKISGAVKSTLGPFGRTVLMESEHTTGGVIITKDGVSVAKNINLWDPVENISAGLIKQAAARTASSAGDGTTTSVVLTEALLDAFDMEVGQSDKKLNVSEVIRKIKVHSDAVIENLSKNSKKLTKGRIQNIATISANNDHVIGKMIADLFKRVKSVTIEKSQTERTHTEVVDGMRIDRGYSTRYFANNSKDECVLDNVYVLLTDIEVNSIMDLTEALEPIVKDGKNKTLLIIGNLSQNAKHTLAANVSRGTIRACHIATPAMGRHGMDIMKDLSAVTGAKYFSEETGDDLGMVSFTDLGRASKVVVTDEKTIITRHAESSSDDLEQYKKGLKEKYDLEEDPKEKEMILKRLASIDGGIGVIFVGGSSDIEYKELHDRIDDSVRAVGSAMEQGVLPGGGIALLRESFDLNGQGLSPEDEAAINILVNAMVEPIFQILRNSGLKDNEVMDITDALLNKDYNYGYNLVTKEFGDMLQMGVIDPAKVTKEALKNAVSVATTIMSTEAIITNIREDENR